MRDSGNRLIPNLGQHLKLGKEKLGKRNLEKRNLRKLIRAWKVVVVVLERQNTEKVLVVFVGCMIHVGRCLPRGT